MSCQYVAVWCIDQQDDSGRVRSKHYLNSNSRWLYNLVNFSLFFLLLFRRRLILRLPRGLVMPDCCMSCPYLMCFSNIFFVLSLQQATRQCEDLGVHLYSGLVCYLGHRTTEDHQFLHQNQNRELQQGATISISKQYWCKQHHHLQSSQVRAVLIMTENWKYHFSVFQRGGNRRRVAPIFKTNGTRRENVHPKIFVKNQEVKF